MKQSKQLLLLLTLVFGALQTAYADGAFTGSESTNHAISAGSSLFPEPVQCNQTSQITQWNGTNWTCLNDNFYVPPLSPPVYPGTPCAWVGWSPSVNELHIWMVPRGARRVHIKRIPAAELRRVGSPYTKAQINRMGGSRQYLKKYFLTVRLLGFWHMRSNGGTNLPVDYNSATCRRSGGILFNR